MEWPETMKERLGGREPKTGDWYAFCCNNDAYQLKTQGDLDQLHEQVEGMVDDGIDPGSFFATEEAVSEHFGGMG